MTLAVVILTHNSAADVVDCLTSVTDESPGEIVVVDNASSDGTADRVANEFPRARVLRNERNTGFAVAANQGVRATTGPYVLLLNPDAKLHRGALGHLREVFDAHARAGAVGALVRNPDGSVQPTKRVFPTVGQSIVHGFVGIFRPDNPGTKAYTLAGADFSSARTVDWVAGPAMAVRREAFDEVGGFDEGFFFFVEDVDLCKRLWDRGWEVWFSPGAEVTHIWGGSWTKRPLRFIWMHQWNLFRYVRKHYRGAWVLAYPAIAAGLLARFVLLAARWLVTRRSVPEHRTSVGDAT